MPRTSGSSTIEYTLFVSAIVACIIIAMDVNTGFFTRALRQTLGITTDSMVEQASYVPKSHGPWAEVLFSGDDLSDFTGTGPGTVSIVNFEGEDVIFVDGYERLVSSSGLMEIDPDKHYVLSGDFMSVGEEAGNLYLGLAPYEADGTLIKSEEAKRDGTPGTVQSISDTEIVVTEDVSDWRQALDYYACHREIGFYLDGDTSHLPDYVISNYSDLYSYDPTEGAYSSTSGNTISLNDAIPDSIASQIVPGTTVVMNQTKGGTYIYAAAGSANPPLDTWTTYTSDIITGTSFNTNTQFWPETAYVNVVFLANYYNVGYVEPPDAEQQMYIRNVTLKEVP